LTAISGPASESVPHQTHDQDFIRAIRFLIENEKIERAVNLAAQNPLPNTEFMPALREAAGIPFGLPATNWMLEIGAFFLRTETELLLKSRRVIPERLMRLGFTFDFPLWQEAARDLCLRWRENVSTPLIAL
jgi:NAD dependent epimerase/dehydratase family enzyme